MNVLDSEHPLAQLAIVIHNNIPLPVVVEVELSSGWCWQLLLLHHALPDDADDVRILIDTCSNLVLMCCKRAYDYVLIPHIKPLGDSSTRHCYEVARLLRHWPRVRYLSEQLETVEAVARPSTPICSMENDPRVRQWIVDNKEHLPCYEDVLKPIMDEKGSVLCADRVTIKPLMTATEASSFFEKGMEYFRAHPEHPWVQEDDLAMQECLLSPVSTPYFTRVTYSHVDEE